MYWIPIAEILEARGIRPCGVHARQMKNVPGRRTDWHECQWIPFLHSVGLLRPAFRPEAPGCAIRAVMRHRGDWVQRAGQHVPHRHKALTAMNLQIQPVILAQLRDPRIKARPEVIQKSLVGNWQPEHLFTRKPAPRLYAEYPQRLAECDAEIERLEGAFEPRVDPGIKPLPPDSKKRRSPVKKRKKRGQKPGPKLESSICAPRFSSCSG